MAGIDPQVIHSNCPPQLDLKALARRGSEVSASLSPDLSSNAQSRMNTPSTSVPTTPIIATRAESPETNLPSQNDPTSFLTALAAQERRVLELKEELQKAESDLKDLKKQWAAHEALKKRNESRQSEQLRTLPARKEMDPIAERSPDEVQRAIERRKTLTNNTRSSQRKVFSGSRHTRTLSLLATRNANRDDCATVEESQVQKPRMSLDASSKHSSNADTGTPQTSVRHGIESTKSPDTETFIETGKQLVGDFRQGFWTFVEDLKQVTVGDESFAGQQPRVMPSSSTDAQKKHGSTSSMPISVDGILVEKADASKNTQSTGPSASAAPIRTPVTKKQERKVMLQSEASADTRAMLSETMSDSDNEPWDDWGTPATSGSERSRSTSNKFTSQAPPDSTEPRSDTSPSNIASRFKSTLPLRDSGGEIPWPVLTRFNPSRLTKTASNLMNEWEKTLTPASGEASVPAQASLHQKDGKEHDWITLQ